MQSPPADLAKSDGDLYLQKWETRSSCIGLAILAYIVAMNLRNPETSITVPIAPRNDISI